MSRNLYFVRHTEPEPGQQIDPSRKLTAHGRQEAEAIGKWLASQIGRVDIVISSPFDRAMQTAEALTKALGSHMATTNGLDPEGRTAEYAWEEITRLAQASKEIMIVGHGPALSMLCLWLMGFDGVYEELRFDYGTVARIALTEPRGREAGKADGTLRWLLDPALVLPEAEVVDAAEALLLAQR